jgi:hypothetical protein
MREPVMATYCDRLSVGAVRQAMAEARKDAAPEQIPRALFAPKHGEALVVVRADDLEALVERLREQHRTADAGCGGGSREEPPCPGEQDVEKVAG